MIKKYQVFVSSTYEDLKEERFCIMQTLLELDCIPSGMELFPAANDDQWSVIKKVIDDCDYYILILGGKYGSTNKDGVSFTEMEYDYAVSKDKIVLPFLIKDKSKLPAFKVELDYQRIERLASFREKVQTKHCKFWETSSDLTKVVSTSLHKQMAENPGIGWVRANELLPSSEKKKFDSITSVGLVNAYESLGDYGTQSDWISLIENAKKEVDVQGRTLFGWTKSTTIADIIVNKIKKDKIHFRWLLMDESNDYVNNLTEENHGIGDMLIQKSIATKKFLSDIEKKIPSAYKKKFEVKFFTNVPLYCSILRVDEHYFICNYLFSAPSNDSPMIHIKDHTKPWAKLYKKEFDMLWKNSR